MVFLVCIGYYYNFSDFIKCLMNKKQKVLIAKVSAAANHMIKQSYFFLAVGCDIGLNLFTFNMWFYLNSSEIFLEI